MVIKTATCEKCGEKMYFDGDYYKNKEHKNICTLCEQGCGRVKIKKIKRD